VQRSEATPSSSKASKGGGKAKAKSAASERKG
jgi:hypothetical protein